MNTPQRNGTNGLLTRTTIVAILLACGSSTEPDLEPGAVLLRAVVTDPSGDAVQSQFGPPAPDLVRVEADVTDDAVAFRIRFAGTSYDSLTTSTFIQIDADQNAATGIPTGLGMDYMVVAQRTQTLGTRAGVLRCPGPSGICPDQTGHVPVIYVANGLDLTIPLAFLGGDDGRMSFRVNVKGFTGSPTDYAPDMNQSPAMTR